MLASAALKVQENHHRHLNERVFSAELANGLRVNFIPRKGFKSGKAMLSAKVGSIDTCWRDQNGKVGKAPAGVAHYLEHQLFKKDDGDLSEQFAELGAYINAHTSHTSTSFYSEFVSNRDENLRLLFRLFFEPYFDQHLVEIERDIIVQEIRLYRDRPYWVGYGEMLAALYQKHAIRFDIAGDELSVGRVKPATLRRTHAAFYAPSNSALTLAGDWDKDEVFDTIASVNEAFAPQHKAPAAEYWDWQEPSEVHQEHVELTMATSAERYLRGYKLPVYKNAKKAQLQELKGNLAMRLAFGAGTQFQEDLYAKGVIASDFSYGLHVERSFAYASLGGTVHSLELFQESVAKRVAEVAKKGFKKADYLRALKKIRGQALRRFDSVSSTVDVHADAWLSNSDPFSWLSHLDEISKEDVEAMLLSIDRHSPSSEVIMRQR